MVFFFQMINGKIYKDALVGIEESHRVCWHSAHHLILGWEEEEFKKNEEVKYEDFSNFSKDSLVFTIIINYIFEHSTLSLSKKNTTNISWHFI